MRACQVSVLDAAGLSQVLSGDAILCFAPDPWDDIWRNRHQIMSRLAQQNKVVYVEPRPYLRPVLHSLAQGWPWRAGRWASEALRGAQLTRVPLDGEGGVDRSCGTGLWVYRSPWYAPLSGHVLLSRAGTAVRTAMLKRALGRIGMERPILWLFRPEMADVPGRFGERLLIYHIVDEYTGYESLGPERARAIGERERALIARADLVLVTSQALLESKGGFNLNTHWVPNGVNYAAFARAAIERREPPEVAHLSHPRVGYVGAINDKIDLDLLSRVARAQEGAALVLVGPVRVTSDAGRAGIQALRGLSNVHFVGRVPVERVPDYVAACDVGLLPYRLNEWTRNIQPLKLYEYLACGLPVVSTDVPAVRCEAEVVRIADGADSFVAAVRQAGVEQNGALRLRRQARAAGNTWTDRVERISALIRATEAAK